MDLPGDEAIGPVGQAFTRAYGIETSIGSEAECTDGAIAGIEGVEEASVLAGCHINGVLSGDAGDALKEGEGTVPGDAEGGDSLTGRVGGVGETLVPGEQYPTCGYLGGAHGMGDGGKLAGVIRIIGTDTGFGGTTSKSFGDE